MFNSRRDAQPGTSKKPGAIPRPPKVAGARRVLPPSPPISRPVSRVLYGGRRTCRVTAIPLGRRLPGASSNLPGRPDPDTGPATCVTRRPYSVLLPVGFAMPLPLPAARCALTAPFHPCPAPPLSLPASGEGRVGERRSVLCGTVPGIAPRFREGFSRRTLSGTACPWSPDFPLGAAFRHWTQAAVRPTDPLHLGLSSHQIKQGRTRPSANGAASRWLTDPRCRRSARGGNGAGRP